MRHPNQDLLLRFAAGAASEVEASRIVSHLDECGACHERYASLRSLREDFEGTWESFLQEAGARIALPRRVATAERAPVLVAAVRGLIQRSHRLASAAVLRLAETGAFGTSLQASFVPVYSGVADPRASTEAREETEAASLAVAHGNDAAALEHLRRAASRDPEAPASASIDLRSGQELAGRIVVDATRGSVSVLVYSEVLPASGGTAVLESAGAPPRRALLQSTPGARFLLAEFEDLPDGSFAVRLEVPGR